MKNRSLALIFGLSIWIVIILGVIHISSLDKAFYREQYQKNEVAENIGINEVELEKATAVLLDYLEGKRDDLSVFATINGEYKEVFNTKEKDHMIDVQVLFVKTIWIRNIALGLLLSVGAYLGFTKKKESIDLLSRGFKEASMVLGVVFVFIVVYAVLDFQNFWILFHKLLFSNDLWLLNPYTDNLILMVPLPFFFSLVSLILFRSLMALGFVFTLDWGLTHQGYDHRFLKWFALITMTIDHVGHFLFPEYIELRVIGRLAFPIFAYLFALTYRYTSNRKRLLIQMSIAALLTQGLLYLTNVNELVNIFFLFMLGWLAFDALDKGRVWLIIVIGGLADILEVDYGMYGIAVLTMFYFYHEQRNKQMLGYIIISLMFVLLPFLSADTWPLIPRILNDFFGFYWRYFIQALSILALALLFFYNKKKPEAYSNKHLAFVEKYFFYVYYAVHLALLGLLRGIL